MSIARAGFGLVVFALVLLAGIGGIQAQADQVKDFDTKYNETFTPPNNSETYSVGRDSLGDYGDAVQVYNASGVEANQSNWNWDPAVGNLTIQDGPADLQNESSATITYRYQQRSQREQQLLSLAGNGMRIATMLVFLMGTLLAVLTIRALS